MVEYYNDKDENNRKSFILQRWVIRIYIVYRSILHYALQGDSGRKVNISGDDNIYHCEKNCSYKHVSNLIVTEIKPSEIYEYKWTVNGKKERDLIY
jgi:hypothetical protein